MADGQSYFLLLFALSVLTHLGFHSPMIIAAPFTYLGILFIGFGLFLCYWTRTFLIQKNTTLSPFETPTALVTSGPFRFSRNPVYLEMTAILTGTAFFLGTGVTFVFPLLFIAIIQIRIIPIEEKSLERVFGAHYREYKGSVRTWI